MSPENSTPHTPSDQSRVPTPPVGNAPQGGLPGKKWFSKRNLIIAVAVLAVLIVGLLIFVLGGKNNGGSSGSPYYSGRAGYDSKSLSAAIGDPEALSFKATDVPVFYGDSKVVQACNVLNPDVIHETGVHLHPNPLTTPVSRTYFDGQGKAVVDPNRFFLPDDEESNSCMYTLNNGISVTMNVYQPAYLRTNTVLSEVSRSYKQQASMNNVAIYADNSNPAAAYYILYNGDVWSRLSVLVFSTKQSTAGVDQFTQKMLDSVTKSFAAQVSNPGGAPRATYDSPVFKKAPAIACEITNSGNFETIFNTKASPLVEEKLGSAVGVIKFPQEGDGASGYNYIETDCQRKSVDSRSKQSHFDISTESYTSDAPAKLAFNYAKSSSQNIVDPTTKVGDESMFSDRSTFKKALTFRQGRFVVTLAFGSPTTNDLKPADVLAKLTPVAQQIAGQLQKMQ